MEQIMVENCEKMIALIPEMQDFLLTGMPDTQLITALLECLPEEEQRKFVNETDHGKKMLSKIKGYQRQFTSVIQDMEQQANTIRHQANKISILESMLEEKKIKSACSKEKNYESIVRKSYK